MQHCDVSQTDTIIPEKATTSLPNYKCRITCQKTVQSLQTITQEPQTSIIIYPYQKYAKLWSIQSSRKNMFNPLWQSLAIQFDHKLSHNSKLLAEHLIKFLYMMLISTTWATKPRTTPQNTSRLLLGLELVTRLKTLQDMWCWWWYGTTELHHM